jgi:hypothetical protein
LRRRNTNKASTYPAFLALANEDCGLTAPAMPMTGTPGKPAAGGAGGPFQQRDSNKDGKLSRDELPAALFDIPITSYMAHMHIWGRAFNYEVIYADDKTDIPLDTPRYDFNHDANDDAERIRARLISLHSSFTPHKTQFSSGSCPFSPRVQPSPA